MTDEPQRLGIISRRVCSDLLQRLLDSASGALPAVSPQAQASVTRSQGVSSSPGSVSSVRQEPEAKIVNGIGGSDDDEDLPPLGGEEDSDKENDRTFAVSAPPLFNVSAKLSPKQTSSLQAQRNAIPLARPIIQARPSVVEEENFVPFRLVRVNCTLFAV